MQKPNLFPSFFLGGFDDSTPVPLESNGNGHEAGAIRSREAEYAFFARLGVLTVREPVRWTEVERRPGHYDFSSVLPTVLAAREHGMQVIWDLFDGTWPEDVDLLGARFVERFSAYAAAFARLLDKQWPATPFVSPVSNISLFTWGASAAGYWQRLGHGRDLELKVQLVRAAIRALDVMRCTLPDLVAVHVDGVNPAPSAGRGAGGRYQTWDMLEGRQWAQLGGSPDHLDVIAIFDQTYNQWPGAGYMPEQRAVANRPLRSTLYDFFRRYRRPLLVVGPGASATPHPGRLRELAEEVRVALRAGVPIEGICLQPALEEPAASKLADELRLQQAAFARFWSRDNAGLQFPTEIEATA